MGFIYQKPLSMEGVFSKFDTDGNGTISKQEAKAAKNMDIFTNFKVKKDMTLDAFESANKDVYSSYERLATEAYNKQQTKIQQWLKMEEKAMSGLQSREIDELEKTEQEIMYEIERERLEEEVQKEIRRTSTGWW